MHTSLVADTAGAYSGFHSILNIATPPGLDASPLQVTPQHSVRFPLQFTGTHLYSWVERGTMRVKCLGQGLNPDLPIWSPVY